MHTNDIFGYVVQLNFNRNGTIHTTVLGGIFSIILKGLYVIYLAYLFNKLIAYDDDKTYIFEVPTSTEEETTAVDFRNLNLQLYHSIYRINQDGYQASLHMTPETSQYISFRFL